MNAGLSPDLLITIAEEYGTPVYVYDVEKIKAQYHRLCDAFSDQPVRIFYASKALTNINILRYIASLGASIDCSSINELKLARCASVPPEKILYTSNSIHFSEIAEAKEAGAFINIDSLSNLRKFGQTFGASYPVGIRLRPNIMAGGNLNISTGHDKSKFGIPVDKIDEILSVVKEYNMHITVLHVHTGSEISDVDLYMRAVHILLRLSRHFPDLKCIDLGGGFKVPYKAGDAETDMPLLAKKIKAAFAEERQKQGRDFEIWFEPGKFLVSEAGYLLASVNVIKETAAAVFAGVDTGFNHLLRPMFYGAYHQIDNITNPDGDKRKYAVVGNICETDTFAWDREIAAIREGDLLLFRNAGAYGFEMASNFNSRYRLAEVLVENGTTRLIRKREQFEDLIRNQIF